MSSQLARRLQLLPAAVAVVAIAVVAAGATGGLGAVAVAATVLLALALLLVLRQAPPESAATARRVAVGAVLLVPAGLTLAFSFASGGFFPGSVASGALVLAFVAILGCAVARRPFAGLGPRTLVPAVALVLFVLWAALSQRWSGTPGRAWVEADRALLYALTFVLFAALGAGPRRVAFALRSVAVAMVLVAAVALLSRVAPDILTVDPLFAVSRLSYPLTYWNALGVFCAIAAVLCLHLAGSTDEPRVARVLAAGALPVLGATLLLTFSRGGLAAAVLGLVAYCVLGRPRALIPAVLAAAPFTFLAVRSAYDATLLASETPTSAAAIVQGHDVGNTVVLCAIGAMLVRALLLLLVDGRLHALRLPEAKRRPVVAGSWAVAALVVLAAAVTFDAPSEANDRWRQFVDARSVGATPNLRDRFASTSNQGRLSHWRAAMEGYREDRLTGTGAGTFPALWYEHRDEGGVVADAHSLYAETLGELGLVGAGLLVVVLLALLAGLLPVARGPDRPLYAALFAAALAWVAHAGLDWDWEMPATTLWLFALGGLALGRPRNALREAADEQEETGRGARHALAGLAGGCVVLAVAVLPASVLGSQVRLDDAVEAFTELECPTAVREARRATELLGARAEPWEVIGLCEGRADRFPAAASAFRSGLERDPDNWRLHASLAAALAAGGEPPGREVAEALRLNPREPALAELRALTASPRGRRARAAAFLQSRGYSGR